MKFSTALKFKRLFCIIISILLFASTVLFTACSSLSAEVDDNYKDPQEPAIEEEKEDIEAQVIRNGRFDLYNEKSSIVYPVTPRDWTYSADSYAGSYAPITRGDYARYGAVSVKEDNYDDDPTIFQTYSMKNNGSITLDNPLAPSQFYNPANEVSETNNDKVLMVQNMKPTAAKYKSSSIQVPQNSYAIISVWVKTVFIKENGEFYEYGTDILNSGQGANIALTGGVNYPVILTGIYTDLEVNNGWAEYQFIIEGSNMSSKTIYLELGLGTGGQLNSIGYTEGFAFFANAEMTFIPQKEFNDYNTTAAGVDLQKLNYDVTLVGTHNPAYRVKQVSSDKQRVSFSFNKMFNEEILAKTQDTLISGGYALSPTLSDFVKEVPTIKGVNVDDDYIIDRGTSSALGAINAYEDALENYPFTDENIIAIQRMSDTENTSIGLVNQNFLTIKENEYYKISFWLKTSDILRGDGGVNVYLYYNEESDGNVFTQYKQFLNIDTTEFDLSEEDKESVLNGNQYDGWRQYPFYVDGGLFNFDASGPGKQLSLEIWFGSVYQSFSYDGTIKSSYETDWERGFRNNHFPEKDSFMMMSNVTIEKLTSSVYNQAQSSENSITGFSLSNKYSSSSSNISNGGFNNPKASERKDDISEYNYPFAPADFDTIRGFGQNGWQSAPAQNVVLSGVLNTNLWGNYLNYPALLAVIGVLTPIEYFRTFDGQTFNSVLMIYNQTLTAFGYYTPFKTLSSNSFYEIQVQVKTSDIAGRGASIYLVDSEGNRFSNYVLDSENNKLLPNNSEALVYNPFYDETYDESEGNSKYRNPSDKDSNENKLLRKGQKYVKANNIPTLNPYYDKDFDKELTWKRETTKYYIYALPYVIPNSIEDDVNSKLYFIVDYDYGQIAEFKGIVSDTEFTTYTFLIKTGYKSLSLRLELWNGERYLDGRAYTATYSKGFVFFDNAEMVTLTLDQNTKIDYRDYYYNYLFEGLDNEYEYNVLNTKIFDVAAYTRMADPIDDVDEEEVAEPTEEEDKEPFNWAALTTILVAAALIIALGAVLVRKFFKKKPEKETTVSTTPSYKRKSNSKQTKK